MSKPPSLPELQQLFAAAMADRPPSALADCVAGCGDVPAVRLRLYRDMVQNDHIDTLRVQFPVVDKLVGVDFFDAAAVRHFDRHPCASGNIHDHGAGFPAFLAGLEEARPIPYLADVARLEWARQRALTAEDADPLPVQALADVPQDRWPLLRLRMQPAASVVDSSFPIFDVWNFCRLAAPGGLRLRAGGQCVLVWRDGYQIAMRLLDAGTAAFVQGLVAGVALEAADDKARHVSADFDPAAALSALFDAGVVVAAVGPPAGAAPRDARAVRA